VKRGDPLVTYNLASFINDSRPLLRKDHRYGEQMVINSPISGIILRTRREETLEFNPQMSLQYPFGEHPLLPVLLVPNDEPPTDTINFYVYDRIAEFLGSRFELLPIRGRSDLEPRRLRDWLNGNPEAGPGFSKDRQTLRDRNPAQYRTYQIRDMNAGDVDLIQDVQHLRSRDLKLRDRLLHIARRFGDSI
jgi:hypothetical protein